MEDIVDNLKSSRNYVERSIIILENELHQKKIDEEYKKYELETEDEFRKRFNNSNNWEKIASDNMSSLEYANVCNGEDCWYKGNTDRLSNCIIYRMIGADDLFLCDMCMDQDCNLDIYIEDNEDRFRKNDKLIRKAKRIMKSVTLPDLTVVPVDDNHVIINGRTRLQNNTWDNVFQIIPKIGYEIDGIVYHISKKSKT
jgi:hypothetical protein